MAQSKARSRITRFKQPFLVGAVTSASLLGGCGGRTEGPGTQPGGLTGTRDECPTVEPAAGSGCASYVSGLECEFHADTSCPRSYRCDEETWEDVSVSCNPPPPSDACPTAMPSEDADCSGYVDGLNCEYSSETDCSGVRFCHDGTWEDQSPTCNPPPPLSEECPATRPTDGAACSDYAPGLGCDYATGTSCPTAFVCGGTRGGDTWQDLSPPCNPPPPEVTTECPNAPVVRGASCEGFAVGLECRTNEEASDACPEASSLSCDATGVWLGPVVICNPPAPLTECPPELPNPGESCREYEVGLECGDATCDGGVGARCGSQGEWETLAIACNPPAPDGETETPDAG